MKRRILAGVSQEMSIKEWKGRSNVFNAISREGLHKSAHVGGFFMVGVYCDLIRFLKITCFLIKPGLTRRDTGRFLKADGSWYGERPHCLYKTWNFSWAKFRTHRDVYPKLESGRLLKPTNSDHDRDTTYQLYC